MKGKSVLQVIISVILIAAMVPVSAETVEELMQKQEATQRKLEETQSQINQAKAQRQITAQTIAALDREINTTQSALNKVEEKIKELDEKISDTEKELSTNTEAFEKRKELLKARLKAIYMNCSFSYVDILVEARDFSEFISRMKLIDYVLTHDKNLISSMEEQLKTIKQKKAELEEQKNSREQEKASRIEKIRSLDNSRAAKDEYIKRLNSDIKELEAMEDRLLEESQQIAERIRGITDKDRKYSNGQMTWPAPSVGKSAISSHFGMRHHPILNTIRMHTGVDIAVGHGKDIVAANKGKVIFTGYETGYGNYVIIDHGVKDGSSITTLYAHASKILVSVGQEVEAGDVIAKVGSTGYATGPHLHFEVRKDGTPVSPKDYLGY